MNFSTQTHKYESIPQPSSNINNINSQNYYSQQPMSNYQGFYPYSGNSGNYQFSGIYYNNYPSFYQTNTDSNININHTNSNKPKRESKPLTVFDPNKNEYLDFSLLHKSKCVSLLDEIQPPSHSHNSIPNLISNSKSPIIESVIAEKPTTVILDEISVKETENKEQKCFVPLIDPTTVLNFPSDETENLFNNKMAGSINSGSETDLYEKSESSSNDVQDTFNEERKIYSRYTLVEIGKSTRSLKKPFSLDSLEFKEIVENEKIITNIFLGRSSLNRMENGYLPPHLRLKEECSLNKHLEDCRRNLKCILNKIAPQNFNVCIDQIKKIIKSSDPQNVQIEGCIDCLIEEIFDKAVKEETYSVTYANLCTQIAKFDDENDSNWAFKSSLLNRCKKMFETPLQDQLKSVKEHWEKKVEEETDIKLKNLYISDIEEQVKKARDKYFGNIRFIGELYLHDLLKPNIIHCCVTSLLPKVNDEDAMLSLCKLLETCGKKFDETYSDKMSNYIASMKDIVNNNCDLGTRIRCTILDIIEMSERKWTLRQIQTQKKICPKTLDEVKNDDSEEKALAASKFPSTKLQNRSGGMKISHSSNELKFNKNHTGNQSIQINSLLVKQNDKINLKPSYGCWFLSDKEKDDNEWTNVEKGKKTGRYKYPSNMKNQPSINKSSPVRLRDESPTKLNKVNKYTFLANTDDLNDYGLSSSTSPIRDSSPCESKSEDDVMMDADELLVNFLETKILNETAWRAQTDHSDLICLWLDKIMEKDKTVRHLVGDQLASFLATDKLPKEILISGLLRFLDLIDDLITDIPKIWIFFSDFLERFIQSENSYVDFIQLVFQSLLPNEKVNECILMTLSHARNRLGCDIIKNLVENNMISLMELLSQEKSFEKQVQLHDLSFLIKSNDSNTKTKFSTEFKSKLLLLLLQNDVELIYQLLEDNFDLNEMQTDEFVYSMACCLFAFICDLPSENDVINFIVENQLFLIRLIDNKPPFENQTLLALVNFAEILKRKDQLLTVVKNLSGKIISTDALHHFVSSTSHINNCPKDHDLLVHEIRSTLDDDER